MILLLICIVFSIGFILSYFNYIFLVPFSVCFQSIKRIAIQLYKPLQPADCFLLAYN